MAVDIHQTGDDGGALQINGILRNRFRQHRPEQAVFYFKSAGHKPKIRGKNSGIFIKHGTNLLYMILSEIWYHEVGKKAMRFRRKVPERKDRVEL